MRAKRTTRVPAAAKLLVAASVLAFPATAMAVSTAADDSFVQPAVTLHAAAPAAVRYGDTTTLRGSAPARVAGLAIELRYRPANAASWRTVARGRVRADGRFALTARVARSGGLQVVAAHGKSSAAQLSSSAQLFESGQASVTSRLGATKIASSQVRHLTVKPRLSLNGGKAPATVLAGTATQVRGHLLPAVAGRRVVLEVQHDHRWVATSAARTTRKGAFDFHYVPPVTSSQRIEVAFAGDRFNSHADSASRSVTPMEYAEVSWYEDAGNTACGFHATYGIASRTLPCGSKVTLSYGGHSVVATVDDRGPFVYSRLYDLNENVAGALHMYGVATVLASV